MPVCVALSRKAASVALAVAPSATLMSVRACAAVRSSGSPVVAVTRPLIVAVTMFASLALVTASLAMVSAVAPVTSPVCVAFDTFAVLAVTAGVAATAVAKSLIVAAIWVPV